MRVCISTLYVEFSFSDALQIAKFSCFPLLKPQVFFVWVPLAWDALDTNFSDVFMMKGYVYAY